MGLAENRREVVQFLLDNGSEVHDDVDKHILCLAIEGGLSDLVPLLVEKGAEINEGSVITARSPVDNSCPSPLATAFYRGEGEIVELLFDRGAALHPRDDYVICKASQERSLDEVKAFLLRAGVERAPDIWQPLLSVGLTGPNTPRKSLTMSSKQSNADCEILSSLYSKCRSSRQLTQTRQFRKDYVLF